MEVIIDTREKKPFEFVESVSKALETGDYSVTGFEDEIAIERKSHDDLFGCLTSARRRFEKQLRRMSEFKYRALVIDTTVSSILMGHLRCKLPGEEALRRLMHLCVKYDIPVYFCDRHGKEVTHNLLAQFVIRENKSI